MLGGGVLVAKTLEVHKETEIFCIYGRERLFSAKNYGRIKESRE